MAVICDRCQASAVEKVIFEMDDQRFDLCASCRQVVLECLTDKPMPEPRNEEETPSSAERRRKKKNG